MYFNPRAPRGARRKVIDAAILFGTFQSTRPARGATRQRDPLFLPCIFQSTRPARGATVQELRALSQPPISIHAPREGRDVLWIWFSVTCLMISIHAPREGRDSGGICGVQKQKHFNPRAPRGARPVQTMFGINYVEFQSTRPARGATPLGGHCRVGEKISIHAPREGRDFLAFIRKTFTKISIHAPREGRDCPTATAWTIWTTHFNPRAPRGARLQGRTLAGVLLDISIHAPREGRDQ